MKFQCAVLLAGMMTLLTAQNFVNTANLRFKVIVAVAPAENTAQDKLEELINQQAGAGMDDETLKMINQMTGQSMVADINMYRRMGVDEEMLKQLELANRTGGGAASAGQWQEENLRTEARQRAEKLEAGVARAVDGADGNFYAVRISADDMTAAAKPSAKDFSSLRNRGIELVITSSGNLTEDDYFGSHSYTLSLYDTGTEKLIAQKTVRGYAPYTDPVSSMLSSIPVTPAKYKIGDRGPGGGTVFYDQGFGSRRYREAAPASTEKNLPVHTDGNDFEDQGNSYCRNMTAGGKSDWYVPSSGEMDLMYRNLKKKNLGGFSDTVYGGTDTHWAGINGGLTAVIRVMDFSSGENYSHSDELNSSKLRNAKSARMRAVRSFY